MSTEADRRSRGHHLLRSTDVPRSEGGSVQVEGEPYNAPVSFFIVDFGPDRGPGPHRHPYAEVFLVRAGRAVATAGGEEIEVAAGDILFVEPGTPHGFRSLGPDRLEIITIHAAGRMETEWLGPG